jgi:WD40 repeat protein
VAIGGIDQVYIYDLNLRLLNTVKVNGTVITLQFLNNWYIAVSSNNSFIQVFAWKTGLLNSTLTGHTGQVNDLELVSTSYLASCSADSTILIWNRNTGQKYRNLTGHTDTVFSILLMSNASLLASASKDGFLKIWTWQNSVCVQNVTLGSVYPTVLQLLTDGSLAVAYSDFSIRIFDWNFSVNKTLIGHSGLVTSIQNLSSNSLVSSSLDGTVILWNLTSSLIQNVSYVSLNGVYFILRSQLFNQLVSGSTGLRIFNTTLFYTKNVTTSTKVYSASQISVPTGTELYFFILIQGLF